jgi:addiction module HigA family antidote
MADFLPAHPGETLREDFLKPLGLSQYALAKAIGVPQIRVSEIAKGKRAITPDTALRLARYFRTSAEFWVGLQPSYDLERAPTWMGCGRDRLRFENLGLIAARLRAEAATVEALLRQPPDRHGRGDCNLPGWIRRPRAADFAALGKAFLQFTAVDFAVRLPHNRGVTRMVRPHRRSEELGRAIVEASIGEVT